ncbi:MAG: hypothetical protein JSV69_07630 [Chloroflexota bacterium]|nr:MAG: hypothetical protein JSV69_07630 [Chloroflexota bacterium]
MIRLITSVSILLMSLIPWIEVDAQEITDNSRSQIIIIAPEPGGALQGTVLVTGEINTEGALKFELSFSYAEDPRNTWFLIHEIDEEIPQEFSLEWDTNTLTDGQYTLRVVLTTSDEQYISSIPGLRIRNYSIIETSTPHPTSTPAPEDTLAPTISPTMTITPLPFTATPFPPNPARIDTRDIGLSLGKGAAAAFGLFVVFGLYQFVRNRRRSGDG